ncbi:MAG: PAS domain S-box protein [bacterium]
MEKRKQHSVRKKTITSLTMKKKVGRSLFLDNSQRPKIPNVQGSLDINQTDSNQEYLQFDIASRAAFFHHILEACNAGMCVFEDEAFLYVNSSLARMLGYRSAPGLLGKNIWKFVHRDSQKILSLIIQRTRRGEPIQPSIEIQLLTLAETSIDAEVSMNLFPMDEKTFIVCSVNDITQRKAIDRRRNESEHLLRNIVDSMIDALIITDLEGRILDVNVGFEQLTGYLRKEVFGMQIPYPWIPEEYLGSYIHWLEELRESKFSHDLDVIWYTRSGKKLFVSINTTLLYNAGGDPVLMLNLARDISERQQARAELSSQIQRLEALFTLTRALTEALDSHQVAKIACDQLFKVISFDALFIEIYDKHNNTIKPLYIVDLIQGKHIEIPVPAEAVPLDKTVASQKVIQEQKPFLEMRSSDLSTPMYEPFGNIKMATKSLLYVPMLSKEQAIGVLSLQSFKENAYTEEQIPLIQSIANIVAIALEKALLYRETIVKSREIEARNRELDDFTYVVSHDLKEPLISVEGYSKIIKSEYFDLLDSTGQEYLMAVLEATSSMKKLIDELLILSRVGKIAEKRVSVNLSRLLKEVLAELRFSIVEKNAKITEDDPLPHVSANEAHLKIVFRNLLSNALKFCDKQVPQIHIGAKEEGEFVRMFVRDNGIGVEARYQEKIFQIFQRLHKRDQFSGTGAGLTIVKKIVESFGGTIWMESEVGEGSTFYFTLPLQLKGGNIQ